MSSIYALKGVELPIYPADTPVVREPWELPRDDPRKRLIRTVSVVAPEEDYTDIYNVLETTDRELTAIAEACGAVVADHSWGLFPVAGKDSRVIDRYSPHQLQYLGIPVGYMVIANVEWISNSERLIDNLPLRQQVVGGIKDYYEDPSAVKQGDIKPEQFIGRPGFSELVYVDVEPYLV